MKQTKAKSTCAHFYEQLRNVTAVYICAILFFSNIACESKNNSVTESKALSLSILHDNDLATADWLRTASEQFKNELSATTPDKNLELNLLQESTAQSIEDLASGKSKAEAILLPHSAFSDLMKGQIRNLGAQLAACKDLIGSPYVIVTPKKNAALLQIILARPIPDLSAPVVAIKLDEVGSLLRNSSYGYAHPQRSARGQFSLLLSVAGISPNLDKIAATWATSIDSIKELQKHLEWYATSDSQLLKRLASQDAFLSSNNQKELTLGIISLRQVQSRSDLKDHLIILMPSDATIWESHSLCISQADWVVPAKRSILQKFQTFLASPNVIEAAKQKGFSAILENNEQVPPAVPFSASKTELTKAYLEKVKKPFSISFAIDTSSTMLPETIGHLKEFTKNLFINSPSEYKIDLINFSSEITVLGNRQSLAGNLESRLSELTPNGGSSIYDAIAKQYEILSKYPISESRRVALIVTDGNDKTSQRNVEDIVGLVSDAQRSNGFISLNVVVLSPSSVDIEPINKIVEAANGTLYKTEPELLPELLAELQKSL